MLDANNLVQLAIELLKALAVIVPAVLVYKKSG